MPHSLFFLLLSGAIGTYSPPSVWDRKTWTDFIPTTRTEIEWGSGFSTLTLRRTFNAATRPTKITPIGEVVERFEVKGCTTAGETLTFLTQPMDLAAGFLTQGNELVDSALRISYLTDLQTTLISKIDIQTGILVMEGWELKEEPRGLLSSRQHAKFVEYYGTHHLRRVYTGGYMYLVLKFSCSSKGEKSALDERLKKHSGLFFTVDEMLTSLQGVRKTIATEISVFTAGGMKPPSKLNLAGAIEFAHEFTAQARSSRAVTRVQYTTLFYAWSSDFAFRSYVVSLQEKVDELLEVVVDLKNIRLILGSVVELAGRDEDLSYLSHAGIERIVELVEQAQDAETELKTGFIAGKNVDHISDISGQISVRFEEIMTEEQYFDSTKTFFLRNKGLKMFASEGSNGYLSFTQTSPILMKLIPVHADPDPTVLFRHDLFFITPSQYPDSKLCFGRDNWYAFWVYKPSTLAMCAWKILPATRNEERFVRFSVPIHIQNEYWSGYDLGLSNDSKWVAAVSQHDSRNNRKHWWTVEKSPFGVTPGKDE